VNNEVACVKSGKRNIYQSYAVVISEIDHRIMAASRRLKQGLRLAGLRLLNSL